MANETIADILGPFLAREADNIQADEDKVQAMMRDPIIYGLLPRKQSKEPSRLDYDQKLALTTNLENHEAVLEATLELRSGICDRAVDAIQHDQNELAHELRDGFVLNGKTIQHHKTCIEAIRRLLARGQQRLF